MIKCACSEQLHPPMRPYSSVDRALPSGGRGLRSNRSRGIAQHKTPYGRFMLGFSEFYPASLGHATLLTESWRTVKAQEATIQPKDPSGFLKRLVHHYQLHIPAEYDAKHGWVQFKRGRLDADVEGSGLRLRITAPNWLGMYVIKRSLNRHVALFGQREQLSLRWARVRK